MVQPRVRREGGQVIVLFVLSMAAMIALAALLFTGAQSIVLRRQLQNAGDASALAGANLLAYNNQGCSAGGNGGAARSTITDAVDSSVTTNIPGFSTSNITVTCPTGYSNMAVQVDLSGHPPSFFEASTVTAKTTSVAVNGQIGKGDYSVALLDPSNPNWRSNRSGCASFLINGGPTVTFEGSIMVDSTCTLSQNSNGDMKAINASFQMIMKNSSTIRLAGEYASGTANHVTPTPVQNYRPILPDPLSGLIKPCNAVDTATNCLGSNTTLPSVNDAGTGQGICKGSGNSVQDPCILTPGTYTGGILAANGSNNPTTLLLRPGVYYIRGGGLQLKSAAARIFAIPSSTSYSSTTAKADFATTKTDLQVEQQFETNCPAPTLANPTPSSCGVLLYNAPGSSGNWNSNSDQITVGAQGIMELRAYNPTYDEISGNRTLFASYKNLVIWQSRQPAPSGSGQTQPQITLNGGGCFTISGTVYATGGKVDFGGNSCGTGGGDATLSLQFICWDLTLEGDNTFYFAYNAAAFTTPTVYGLIK